MATIKTTSDYVRLIKRHINSANQTRYLSRNIVTEQEAERIERLIGYMKTSLECCQHHSDNASMDFMFEKVGEKWVVENWLNAKANHTHSMNYQRELRQIVKAAANRAALKAA